MDRRLKVTVVGPHSPTDIKDEHGRPARTKHAYQCDGDKFSWKTDDGDIEVDFDPNHHPFEAATPPPYKAKKGEWTKPVAIVDGGKDPDEYKYTIKITGVVPDDPKVIIDSGTVDSDSDSDSLMLLGDPSGVRDSAKDLLNTVVSELKSATASKDSPIFFKDGINLISVDVEVGGVKVIIKVGGPNVSG